MKTKGKKMLMETYLPVILAKLEAQIVKNNNSDSGWICTNSKVCTAISILQYEPTWSHTLVYILTLAVLSS